MSITALISPCSRSLRSASRFSQFTAGVFLGFTQDLFDDSGDLEPEAAAALASELGASHPYAVEMALAVTHGGALGGCDDDAEFEFALDFILDGLARLQSG